MYIGLVTVMLLTTGIVHADVVSNRTFPASDVSMDTITSGQSYIDFMKELRVWAVLQADTFQTRAGDTITFQAPIDLDNNKIVNSDTDGFDADLWDGQNYSDIDSDTDGRVNEADTAFNSNQLEGRDPGNKNGDIAINNGTVNDNLYSDTATNIRPESGNQIDLGGNDLYNQAEPQYDTGTIQSGDTVINVNFDVESNGHYDVYLDGVIQYPGEYTTFDSMTIHLGTAVSTETDWYVREIQ